MVDIVTPDKRKSMMSGIRGKNTKPEVLIRKELFLRGFRYRIHNATLPGKPDIVMRKHNASIFINGCFWHKHDCHLFKWPQTQEEFWRKKIEDNYQRDKRNQKTLQDNGWRVMVLWECSTRGKNKYPIEDLLSMIVNWLHSDMEWMEIGGCQPQSERNNHPDEAAGCKKALL